MTLATTAHDFGTPLTAPPPNSTVDAWPESERSPAPTDTNSYATKLFGVPAGLNTDGKLSGDKIVSLADYNFRSGLLARIRRLRQTPVDERWPGADWPTASAFRDAEDFIRGLSSALVPAPQIALADDGEVNFLWQEDGIHVDLGFYGTNTYSYFAQARDGQKLHGEEIPPSSGLPSEVEDLFAA